MKRTILLLLIFFVLTVETKAQWSDKTNYFTDSNHMAVSTATGDQVNAFSIRSYPDSGYIIFWEDNRNSSNTGTDIYAQKFNKNGKRLWVLNGIPVSTGPNRQHFFPSMSLDSRNYSYAATDSANGFYITYIDDSLSTYDWQRIMVQHIDSTGKAVFGTTGYIIAQSKGNGFTFDQPQLIADGNKGFFISYKRLANYDMDVFVFCYKDNNGKLKPYGGGQMDENAYLSQVGSCNNYAIAYRDAYVWDYMIYPDLQHGCNIVMSLSENGLGNNSYYTGFNRLIRVKKNTATRLYGDSSNNTFTYSKDTVVPFYRVYYITYQWQCGDQHGTGYTLESNGFQKVGNYAYSAESAQGVTLPTSGNINVDITTTNVRLYTTSVTPWFTQQFINRSERYSDMPYEFKVSPFTPCTYLNNTKPGLNKINGGTDTLFSDSTLASYFYCLKGSNSSIYAIAKLGDPSGYHNDVMLQHLQLTKQTADSFTVQITTGTKKGVIIGKDTSTGFAGSNIAYGSPQLAVDTAGNAVFYISDASSFPRVSPVISGTTQLAWGAMGRPAGTGMYAGHYYTPAEPFMTIDPTNGTGILTWYDSRNYNGIYSYNIMMRHIDKLNASDYSPPLKPVYPANGYGGNTWPVALMGSTNKYTLLELWDGNTGNASPAVEIQDNHILGVVYVNIFENVNSIRKYNNQPYLDRDLNITTEKQISANTKILVRLFFTTADFNALKAADASVHTPADLIIVRQPTSSNLTPQTYNHTGNEKSIAVQSWKAVSNGYYIQAGITNLVGSNNYFIFPAGASTLVQSPPVITAATDHSFIKDLYPTPVTNGNLQVQTGNAQVTTMLVEIYSADGRLLFKKVLPYATQIITLPELPGGEYNVNITSGNYIFEQSAIFLK